jgi:acyl-homoserine-lactone acylase
MEANLIVGDPERPDLNASGVVFMGAPFLGIGYSDDIGWTHTVNTIQNANLYQIALNADGTYNFGGKATPLQHRTDAIMVRGRQVPQTIDIYASKHGPIVARNGAKALALRVAGLDQPAVATQYWRMIKARHIDEFIAANSALQMPFFNVIYADRDGHILYLFGGRQPVRQNGDWGKYAGVLDGGDPALLWTQTFDWWRLPRAIDPPGGFVANSNDPPWTSTFPQVATNNPANFPAYVAPQFMDLRPQHGALFLLSPQSANLTLAQVIAGKESTYMILADRVLPDLIAAANASGNAAAQNAAAVLAAWDRTSDASSVGAALFEAWWNSVVAAVEKGTLPPDNTIDFYSPHPQFRVGWSASNPLHTPAGLSNPAALVPYLVGAAAYLGIPTVAWGDVHKVVLADHDKSYQTIIPTPGSSQIGFGLPQSGADDAFGPLRIVNQFPAPDGKHLWSYGGDGYVQVVEFARNGVKARALLGYGNASRPGSAHITDQLAFFESKTLRAVYRTRPEIENHMVSREVLPDAPSPSATDP